MEQFLIHQIDKEYNSIYEDALNATQMEHSEARYARFYNTLQFYKQSRDLFGVTAEAGCWRGLFSYMLLRYRSTKRISHAIFDSFEGLSEPSADDFGRYSEEEMKGRFSCSIDQVNRNLVKFDNVYLYKGWIPRVLYKADEECNPVYSFVHVDVELFEPTYHCLKYFWSRMCKGGILVCDDCGYLSFPGSNKAMNKFCNEERLSPIYLTTGNGVLIKR